MKEESSIKDQVLSDIFLNPCLEIDVLEDLKFKGLHDVLGKMSHCFME